MVVLFKLLHPHQPPIEFDAIIFLSGWCLYTTGTPGHVKWIICPSCKLGWLGFPNKSISSFMCSIFVGWLTNFQAVGNCMTVSLTKRLGPVTAISVYCELWAVNLWTSSHVALSNKVWVSINGQYCYTYFILLGMTTKYHNKASLEFGEVLVFWGWLNSVACHCHIIWVMQFVYILELPCSFGPGNKIWSVCWSFYQMEMH